MNKKVIKIIVLIVIFLVVGFLLGTYIQGKNTDKEVDPVLNEYENYLLKTYDTCPFISTAVTSDCLDEEIKKQGKEYDILVKELLGKADFEAKELESKGEPVYPEINNLLNTIPEYSAKRGDNIKLLCSVKNVLIGGTAIVEESRKCWMYYNSKDIEMMKDLISKY